MKHNPKGLQKNPTRSVSDELEELTGSKMPSGSRQFTRDGLIELPSEPEVTVGDERRMIEDE